MTFIGLIAFSTSISAFANAIFGENPNSMCRAGFTGPQSVDLAEFVHCIPTIS